MESSYLIIDDFYKTFFQMIEKLVETFEDGRKERKAVFDNFGH